MDGSTHLTSRQCHHLGNLRERALAPVLPSSNPPIPSAHQPPLISPANPANLHLIGKIEKSEEMFANVAEERRCEMRKRRDERMEEIALKFGIDSILKPEFGTKNPATKGRAPASLPWQSQSPVALCLPSPPLAAESTYALQKVQRHLACCPSLDSDNGNLFPFAPAAIAAVASADFCCPVPLLAASCSLLEKSDTSGGSSGHHSQQMELLPPWIFCTRYSDRPTSGQRIRKPKKRGREQQHMEEEKRPRTAFTAEQLDRLKNQFLSNRYLTEKRRQELAHELGLNESQIKIWFQNKRAKLKKSSAQRAHQNQAQERSAAAIQTLISLNRSSEFYRR